MLIAYTRVSAHSFLISNNIKKLTHTIREFSLLRLSHSLLYGCFIHHWGSAIYLSFVLTTNHISML